MMTAPPSCRATSRSREDPWSGSLYRGLIQPILRSERWDARSNWGRAKSAGRRGESGRRQAALPTAGLASGDERRLLCKDVGHDSLWPAEYIKGDNPSSSATTRTSRSSTCPSIPYCSSPAPVKRTGLPSPSWLARRGWATSTSGTTRTIAVVVRAVVSDVPGVVVGRSSRT